MFNLPKLGKYLLMTLLSVFLLTALFSMTASSATSSIQISPSSLPDVFAGVPYSQAFSASGGAGPYSFTESGALPPGLSFSDGTLSGTSTWSDWVFVLTISATDTQGNAGSHTYYLTTAASNSSSSSASTTPPVNEISMNFKIGSTVYYLNGQAQSMDASPIIMEGRTLLPITYVATPLGATIGWNQDQQQVTITSTDKVINLWIGMNTASVNGAVAPIDPDNTNVAPIVVPPGRTMLPLRFIAEQLGCEVNWDQTQQAVTVTYKK